MGTAIVNDDGAIIVIPFGAPAMKASPVKVIMIVMRVVILYQYWYL